MIRALLYAAFLLSAYNANGVNIYAPIVPTLRAILPDTGTIASSKPFIVTWQVRWNPPLKDAKHSRRFSSAQDAVAFEMAAPLCAKRPAPCVAWIHSDVVTFSPRIKIASLPKGGVS